MMNQLLTNRAKSGFPVSIGTGLALETLFTPIEPVIDENRAKPEQADITQYTNLIVNISTLLRNIISSVNGHDAMSIPASAYYDALLEEISWLTDFVNYDNNHVSFYVNTYKYPIDTYGPKNKLRLPFTTKQLYIDGIIKYCLSKITKNDDVNVFSNKVTYNDKSVLMLTHTPWDLLSYTNYVKCDLLESHTGVIKSRKNWNTKYYKIADVDMSFLPFMEYLLVVFGDNVMFKPDTLEKRMQVYQSLKKLNVTPLSKELSLDFIKSLKT